jgi:hypothetical protein
VVFHGRRRSTVRFRNGARAQSDFSNFGFQDQVTNHGSSRSAAIRQAVLEAARRRERAAEMRRAVLRMDRGQPDGVNVAEELARDRTGER